MRAGTQTDQGAVKPAFYIKWAALSHPLIASQGIEMLRQIFSGSICLKEQFMALYRPITLTGDPVPVTTDRNLPGRGSRCWIWPAVWKQMTRHMKTYWRNSPDTWRAVLLLKHSQNCSSGSQQGQGMADGGGTREYLWKGDKSRSQTSHPTSQSCPLNTKAPPHCTARGNANNLPCANFRRPAGLVLYWQWVQGNQLLLSGEYLFWFFTWHFPSAILFLLSHRYVRQASQHRSRNRSKAENQIQGLDSRFLSSCDSWFSDFPKSRNSFNDAF